MLESVGQVKGNAGLMESGFFVITKNELSLLEDQGRFTINPNASLPNDGDQGYFYINSAYVDIFKPSNPKEAKK